MPLNKITLSFNTKEECEKFKEEQRKYGIYWGITNSELVIFQLSNNHSDDNLIRFVDKTNSIIT